MKAILHSESYVLYDSKMSQFKHWSIGKEVTEIEDAFKAFEDGGRSLFQINSDYAEELRDFLCLLGSRAIPGT